MSLAIIISSFLQLAPIVTHKNTCETGYGSAQENEERCGSAHTQVSDPAPPQKDDQPNE